jgi:hypothetical protein
LPRSVCACLDQANQSSFLDPQSTPRDCGCCRDGLGLALICAWFGASTEGSFPRSCCEVDEDSTSDDSEQLNRQSCCRKIVVPEPRLLKAKSVPVDLHRAFDVLAVLSSAPCDTRSSIHSEYFTGPPLQGHVDATTLKSQVLRI